MYKAREEIWLTFDRQEVVPATDTRAAFLLVGKGCFLPDAVAARYGLLDVVEVAPEDEVKRIRPTEIPTVLRDNGEGTDKDVVIASARKGPKEHKAVTPKETKGGKPSQGETATPDGNEDDTGKGADP